LCDVEWVYCSLHSIEFTVWFDLNDSASLSVCDHKGQSLTLRVRLQTLQSRATERGGGGPVGLNRSLNSLVRFQVDSSCSHSSWIETQLNAASDFTFCEVMLGKVSVHWGCGVSLWQVRGGDVLPVYSVFYLFIYLFIY
jgi:hypothetical protein